MQLRYGLYGFIANNSAIKTERQPLWNKGGQCYAFRDILQAAGSVFGDGNGGAVTTAQMTQLQQGLIIPNQDLALYDDDGSLTAIALPNNTSLSGVRVEVGPSFDQPIEPFNIQKHFSFRAWAEYPIISDALGPNPLLEFHEHLYFSGGKPLFVCQEALNGPGQRQQTYQQERYTCIQEGWVVGYRAFPPLPPKKFPNSLKREGTPRKTTPERRTDGIWTGYRIDYRYEFEDVIPLLFSNTNPTLWKGLGTAYYQ